MHRALLALPLAAALTAAGCGANAVDRSSQTNPAPLTQATPGRRTPPTASRTVVMKDISFKPDRITVKTGTTIIWRNQDDVPHDVVATSGANFKSDLFGKGGDFQYTPQKPGTINYVCTVHPGMEASIKVTG